MTNPSRAVQWASSLAWGLVGALAFGNFQVWEWVLARAGPWLAAGAVLLATVGFFVALVALGVLLAYALSAFDIFRLWLAKVTQ